MRLFHQERKEDEKKKRKEEKLKKNRDVAVALPMEISDRCMRWKFCPNWRRRRRFRSWLHAILGFPEILRGIPLNPYVKRYMPPFDEFEVDSCCLPSGASVVFPAVPGPSIFIVMAGNGSVHTDSTGEDIIEGDVFIVPAKTMISLTASFVGDKGVGGNGAAAFGALELFRAGVNSRFLE